MNVLVFAAQSLKGFQYGTFFVRKLVRYLHLAFRLGVLLDPNGRRLLNLWKLGGIYCLFQLGCCLKHFGRHDGILAVLVGVNPVHDFQRGPFLSSLWFRCLVDHLNHLLHSSWTMTTYTYCPRLVTVTSAQVPSSCTAR